VGAIAAELTVTGQIGFIAGMDIPIMNRFRCGFEQGVGIGASALNKQAVVKVRYVGSSGDAFSNPAKGKDIAEALFDDGVDIIYHAAGATGNGIIQAARNRNKMVIGVDTDQSYIAPGTVVTSMRKRIDRAVADAILDVALGRFSGGTVEMGVRNGGVDYVPRSQDSDTSVPQWNAAFVDSLRSEISSGSLEVCP
jgi:basic membrane protein A